MKKLNQNQVSHFANQFLLPSKLEQLCTTLSFDLREVKTMSVHPQYKEFLIPKGNGSFRIIEAPYEKLMLMLKEFNFYLQAAYYQHQTPVSYGFIMSVRNEKKHKNILENARQHLGKKYMLKIDLKDFFHQVSKRRIYDLLKNKPFNYSNSTAQTLSSLFTYKGRLPMGSPTSPALSNFATIKLDNDLETWSREKKITYTRFADDMTFSTNKEMLTTTHLEAIKHICTANYYILKDKKTSFYKATDKKVVTGLVLNETIDIEPQFYKELEKDITRLHFLVEATIIVKQNSHSETLKKYKQEVQGKINFIGMIEGYQSSIYYRYHQQVKEALNPTNGKLFSRWTHFNYF